MNREDFYAQLTHALVDLDFRFSAADFPQALASQDTDGLARAIRLGVTLLPRLAPDLSSFMFKLNSFFDPPGVQRELDSIRQCVDMVCFKYLLSQPIIIAVVDGDRVRNEEALAVTDRVDATLLKFRKYTGTLGFTRLSVTGFTLWVFFDSAAAQSFKCDWQAKCKRFHMWQQTWLLPWTVDVTQREVVKHPGALPVIIPQILSTKSLAARLFSGQAAG